MTVDIALKKALHAPTAELAEALRMPRNTVDSIKHRFRKNSLPLQRKISILESLGHEVAIVVLWKNKQK